jgi:hypothetical protein
MIQIESIGGRRVQINRATMERLLNPESRSVTRHTRDKAARSPGERLRLALLNNQGRCCKEKTMMRCQHVQR